MRQGKEAGVLPATGKSLMCLETKPVLATLIAFSLIMLTYNLQPYYHSLGLLSLSSTSTCHCSLSLSSPNSSTSSSPLLSLSPNTTSSPILSLSSRKLSFPKPSPTLQPNPKPTNPDPNKRTFTAVGNAAALFVQMGAYRGGPNTFAIIGLASKPTHVYGNPWYKCEYIPNSNGTTPSLPIRSKAYKILPDWGYGRVYTVVVVNCTFPTNPNPHNLGGKLMLNAYYSLSPRKFERLLSLEEPPNSYNESTYNPPFNYDYDYLYCGSSLYGNLSASRIREWVAYHAWFFGEKSHFVFHDAGGVSEEVRAVLEPWVKLGRVTVQDIREQEQYDGYYYNQFLVVNDCLHRYRFAAKWTFFYDVDEYIYLPDGKDKLDEVMKQFDGVTQFTIEQNPMSSMLCLNESNDDYSRQWGFEKLLFRDSRTRIRRDRKYAIQARNAYASGVHMSENVVGKTLHHTESKIRYYHYHNSIQVKGEPCRVFLPPSAKRRVNLYEKLPYVYDDNMKKLADTVKQFERQTLGTSQLPL